MIKRSVSRTFCSLALFSALMPCHYRQTTSQSLLTVLSPSHNSSWTSSSSCASVTPFSLPPHMSLLLGDVDAGSNTPSMVGKVLAWKKASPVESERVWNELSQSNEELAKVFGSLKEEYKSDREAYEKEVERLSRLPSKEVILFLSQRFESLAEPNRPLSGPRLRSLSPHPQSSPLGPSCAQWENPPLSPSNLQSKPNYSMPVPT